MKIEVRMLRRRYQRLEPELVEEISRKLQGFVRGFLLNKRRAFAPDDSVRAFAPEEIPVEWILIEYGVDLVDLNVTVFLPPDLLSSEQEPSLYFDITFWLGKTPLLLGVISTASLSIVSHSAVTHNIRRLS